MYLALKVTEKATGASLFVALESDDGDVVNEFLSVIPSRFALQVLD